MALKHIALAGITALSFSQIALANDSAKQSSSGTQRQEQSAQGQSQDQDTIKQAQEKLSEKGHQVQADGKMGPKTQAALKDFQKDEGIQQSGKLDQDTLAKLGVNEASSGTGSTSSSSDQSGSSSSK